ncbi:hypothetical protein HanRHA438_Chr05g0212211 [Helianthus annuus]|nr:hypothetical protein HanRHA438_Chr05g0212211 [Helianthus annuus]
MLTRSRHDPLSEMCSWLQPKTDQNGSYMSPFTAMNQPPITTRFSHRTTVATRYH